MKKQKERLTLNLPNSTNSNIPIPKLLPTESHNVLLCDLTNNALNLLRRHATARRDDLAADVLGDGGGAVEGEEDGGFELGFCALDFPFGYVVAEA